MIGHEKIMELVNGELNDYGFFDIGEIQFEEQYDDNEYYSIDIKSGHGSKEKTLRFKYDRKEDEIYVELSEDTYELTRSFDWQVKYFWMALLTW